MGSNLIELTDIVLANFLPPIQMSFFKIFSPSFVGFLVGLFQLNILTYKYIFSFSILFFDNSHFWASHNRFVFSPSEFYYILIANRCTWVVKCNITLLVINYQDNSLLVNTVH